MPSSTQGQQGEILLGAGRAREGRKRSRRPRTRLDLRGRSRGRKPQCKSLVTHVVSIPADTGKRSKAQTPPAECALTSEEPEDRTEEGLGALASTKGRSGFKSRPCT
jgi:hypothetical protein